MKTLLFAAKYLSSSIATNAQIIKNAPLKVWSTKEFPLPQAPGLDQPFNSLARYKQTGVMVDILYSTVGNRPFFALGAWKTDGITAILEFKDKNRNPHPAMPSKTIYINAPLCTSTSANGTCSVKPTSISTCRFLLLPEGKTNLLSNQALT